MFSLYKEIANKLNLLSITKTIQDKDDTMPTLNRNDSYYGDFFTEYDKLEQEKIEMKQKPLLLKDSTRKYWAENAEEFEKTPTGILAYLEVEKDKYPYIQDAFYNGVVIEDLEISFPELAHKITSYKEIETEVKFRHNPEYSYKYDIWTQYIYFQVFIDTTELIKNGVCYATKFYYKVCPNTITIQKYIGDFEALKAYHNKKVK